MDFPLILSIITLSIWKTKEAFFYLELAELCEKGILRFFDGFFDCLDEKSKNLF
jgi:hypothetical protein